MKNLTWVPWVIVTEDGKQLYSPTVRDPRKRPNPPTLGGSITLNAIEYVMIKEETKTRLNVFGEDEEYIQLVAKKSH